MSIPKSTLVRTFGILLVLVLTVSLIIPAVRVPASEPEETLPAPELEAEEELDGEEEGEEPFAPFQAVTEYPTIENKLLSAGDLSVQSGDISIRLDNETPVIIPDPGLEAAFRAALKKPTGEIYQDDLLLIVGLDANRYGISNLSGIEYCTNLSNLSLGSNDLTDISLLASLTNLQTLLLFYNQIVSISPLQGLTDLETLYLDGNQLVEITHLASLTELRALALSSNDIVDISPLESLTYLEFLSLSDNQIVNFSYLSFLTRLKSLDLSNNQINNVSELRSLLSNMAGLEYLGLTGCQINDLSPLSGLTTLRFLYLNHNQIDTFSPLASLTSLIVLGLSKNQISDLTPLASLTRLIVLDLSENQISDLTPLSGLTNLRSLSLFHNQIKSISPLSGLTNLQKILNLGSNQINNISALAGLTNLSYLYLYDNRICDISALVANYGLGSGDYVDLTSNSLDLTSGSQNMTDILTLANVKGVSVSYQPQQNEPAGLYISGSLPDGEVKVPYPVRTLTAMNSTGDYAWSLKKGDQLPPGLRLNITNTITPTKPTTTTITTTKPTSTTTTTTVTVTTTTSQPTTTTTIAPTTTTIATDQLASSIVATSTAIISGKPTKAGTYTFTILVADKSTTDLIASQEFTVTIYPSLAITSTSAIKAEVGACLDYKPGAKGGNGQNSWTLSKFDIVPPWLEFEIHTNQVHLSGTPTLETAAKSYHFTLTATDTLGGKASKKVTIKVLKSLAITTKSLPPCEIGVKYKSTALKAQGGTGRYTWDIIGATLPKGMYLEKGIIKGTPEVVTASLQEPENGGGGGGGGGGTGGGGTTIAVRVKDELGGLDVKIFSLEVCDKLEINDLSNGVVEQAYSHTLTADGGKGPYKFSLTGKLPKGLKFSSKTATISGIPGIAGTFPVKVKVTDALKGTQTKILNITIGQLVLTLTTHDSADSWWVTNTLKPWIKEVYEATGGGIVIEAYYGGEVVGPLDAYDAVATGLVDIAYFNTRYDPNRFQLENMSLLSTSDKVNWRPGTAYWELIQQFPEWQAEFDQVHLLSVGQKLAPYIGTTHRSINTFGDMKGLKLLATSEWRTNRLQALGSVPVALAPEDLYQALQRGVLDGCIISVDTFLDLELGDVISYLSRVNLGGQNFAVCINKDSWNSLPPQYREIMTEAGEKLTQLFDDVQVDAQNKFLDVTVASYGIEVVEPPQSELDKFELISAPLRDQLAAELDADGLPGSEVRDAFLLLEEKYSAAKYGPD